MCRICSSGDFLFKRQALDRLTEKLEAQERSTQESQEALQKQASEAAEAMESLSQRLDAQATSSQDFVQKEASWAKQQPQ